MSEKTTIKMFPPIARVEFEHEGNPTLGELYEALGKMKDHFHLPVWIGVDAGEGCVPLRGVCIESGRYVDFDGDEQSLETFDVDLSEGQTEADIPAIYSDHKDYGDGTIRGYMPIVIIGASNTFDDIDYNKKQHVHEIEKERKRLEKEQKRKELEQDPDFIEMKALEEKLKNKGKLT